MTLPARLMRSTQAFFNRIKSPAAVNAVDAQPGGSIESLCGRKYCLVVTFRRDGTAVPTPVWFGVADGIVYFRSLVDNGKLKRIRHTSRVLVAPCTVRGRPLAAPFAADARIVPPRDAPDAEMAIRSNYGPSRRVYNRLIAHRVPGVYVATTPRLTDGALAADTRDAELERRMLRAYEGETFGEAMFTTMAALRTDDTEVTVLRTLAELEATMRAALEPVLHRIGTPKPDHDEATRRGEKAAAALAATTWAAFLSEFATGTNKALEGYAKLRVRAACLDEPALEALIMHEEALQQFAVDALSHSPDALAPIRATIEKIRALSQ